jgi:hypothetical protein
MKHTCAQPSIYPLALLDKIAIEFNNEILEGRHQYVDYTLGLACEYPFRLMSQFGIPKELLLVRSGKIPQPSFQGWLLNSYLHGHTKIELVESDEEALLEHDPETMRTDELVLQFVQERLGRIKESPWLQAGMPRISCVDVKKEGSVKLEYQHKLQSHGRCWRPIWLRCRGKLPAGLRKKDLAVGMSMAIRTARGMWRKLLRGTVAFEVWSPELDWPSSTRRIAV